MMIVEGQKVIYAGDTDPFQEVGAPGKVIAMSGEAAHVQWLDGPKRGSIDLVEVHELVGDRQQAEALLSSHQPYFESTLDMAATSVPRTAALDVRASYDEQGEQGAITALDESGYLASLANHAEEAYCDLLAKISSDTGLRSALSQLEGDEVDAVIGKIASTLMVDRLREG